MQYAVPQMMAPAGQVVQQMPAQMAMQFIAQQGQPGSEMGQNFVNGQDNNCQQAGGSSIQAQMNMIKPAAWQPEAGAAADGQLDQGQLQKDGVEVPGQNSAMSGVGSSDSSSKEGARTIMEE